MKMENCLIIGGAGYIGSVLLDKLYNSYNITVFDSFFFNKIKELKQKYRNIKFVKDGGWHFSYIKTPENIEEKLKSYAHHREYDLSSLSLQKIKKKIDNKESIYNLATDMKKSKFDSGQKLVVLEINQLPNYIENNLDKYKQWLD